ncbi:hypothetical protein L3556_00290 [Candidatus Synechococcus calcipolaris G9]|uniref:Uncharacterized protein n=1 Tax=Candidatus Synechococcus calcipolaris G9 TaxID=1497997 RepID=A0ABT6EWU1_9SYNE|nr:hypothetical protein [Candidatus Synechococcus calcipolaris]MDG2989375.1 hypothetical protein [Candidatus Synechococcus calcipolaris G9]
MAIFQASVQYGDLRGSAAADKVNSNCLNQWLENNGYITDELVVGISMLASENYGSHEDPVIIKFLVTDLQGYESVPDMLRASDEPLQVREINVDMSIVDFLAFFSRFEITLSTLGLIEGKEYHSDPD